MPSTDTAQHMMAVSQPPPAVDGGSADSSDQEAAQLPAFLTFKRLQHANLLALADKLVDKADLRPPDAKRSGMAQATTEAAAAAAPAAECLSQAAAPEVQELVELRQQAQAAQQRALQLMQSTVTELQQVARVMRVVHGAQQDANQAYERLQAALAGQQLHSADAKRDPEENATREARKMRKHNGVTKPTRAGGATRKRKKARGRFTAAAYRAARMHFGMIC